MRHENDVGGLYAGVEPGGERKRRRKGKGVSLCTAYVPEVGREEERKSGWL